MKNDASKDPTETYLCKTCNQTFNAPPGPTDCLHCGAIFPTIWLNLQRDWDCVDDKWIKVKGDLRGHFYEEKEI